MHSIAITCRIVFPIKLGQWLNDLIYSVDRCFNFMNDYGSNGKASACSAGDRVRSLGWEDPLEKEMATHSSTLAWKIPWTEEPDGLQSMGLQSIGHDWTTSLSFQSVLVTINKKSGMALKGRCWVFWKVFMNAAKSNNLELGSVFKMVLEKTGYD